VSLLTKSSFINHGYQWGAIVTMRSTMIDFDRGIAQYWYWAPDYKIRGPMIESQSGPLHFIHSCYNIIVIWWNHGYFVMHFTQISFWASLQWLRYLTSCQTWHKMSIRECWMKLASLYYYIAVNYIHVVNQLS
jgi:hypothetical protein